MEFFENLEDSITIGNIFIPRINKTRILKDQAARTLFSSL